MLPKAKGCRTSFFKQRRTACSVVLEIKKSLQRLSRACFISFVAFVKVAFALFCRLSRDCGYVIGYLQRLGFQGVPARVRDGQGKLTSLQGYCHPHVLGG